MTQNTNSITMQSRASFLVLLGIISCFILSGFAALLYQTAWMRQFSLVFGTSELAVAAVLSAYMGGLALGASIAAKYVHRINRPVLFYGLLEAGIALSALAVPLLLKMASFLYISVLGNQPDPVDASGLGQSFFYLIVAFIVLAIPTAFMGATLPLLTKYAVKSKQQIGTRVGLLYASNTIGAIGGTLVAGFLLLPLLGLNGTVWVGVAINLLVFIIAALIAKSIGKLENEGGASQSELSQQNIEASNMSKWRQWILPVMLISGATSFVYEVLWTRLLGHVLGGSITAFSTMLAGFLSGIAIGSAIASRFAYSKRQATLMFIIAQIGIALTSMFIYYQLPSLIPRGTAGLSGNVLLAIIVLLPATIFIGATFPLAVRILATEKDDASSSSARIFAWNTVGAIVGATVAAFFLIPLLKYEGAIKLAVSVNLILALVAALQLRKETQGWQSNTGLLASLILLVGVFFVYAPKMPEAVLRSSAVYALSSGSIRYYEVGRSATVVIIEDESDLNLRTNGLPEATTIHKGSPPYAHNQRMLATMPVLARPDIESMLIVGLGAGVALEGVPKSVQSVDVIELEPQVLEANLSIGSEREIDPLIDPRMNIIINDARSALTLTDKKYDSIVSQPSHPWTAGASHLYTREFMSLAKDHLNPNGVYLQWMNSQFVDEYLLRSLSATMLDVFPFVRVYQWNPEVLFFLGSDQSLDDVENAMAGNGRPLIDDVLTYRERGVSSVEDMIFALAMDQTNVEVFAQRGQVITDDDNIMATRSERAMSNNTVLTGARLQSLISVYDPLLQEASQLRTSRLAENLDYPYISKRLTNAGLSQRASDMADSLIDVDNNVSKVLEAIELQENGRNNEAETILRDVLENDPSNQQARYALLTPWFTDFLSDEVLPEHIQRELVNLEGSALSVVRGLQAAKIDDMQALANLDVDLAEVLPTDLWHQASIKLRAEWRIRVTTPNLQPILANEAIALLDSTIPFYYISEFLSLRLRAAMVSEDSPKMLQTGRQLNNLNSRQIDDALYYYSDLAAAEARTLMAYENQITEALSLLESNPDIAESTLASLRKANSKVISQLNSWN